MLQNILQQQVQTDRNVNCLRVYKRVGKKRLNAYTFLKVLSKMENLAFYLAMTL